MNQASTSISAATAASNSDLQASGVTKRFGAFTAVADLSFSVGHGSFFSILGPSGCGKTTLLRMIAGFQSPDSGDIVIGGKSMQGVLPNKRTGGNHGATSHLQHPRR